MGRAVLWEGRHIDNECMRSQGRIQDFSKMGSLDPQYKKRGGGGGGDAVHFRSDTKSGGGECVLECCPLQVRYKKCGGGGGCLPYDG